jgi:hypothetical protein
MSDALSIDRLAARLESLGLGPFVAGLLEAGGEPLGFLAAQSLYLAQPALGLFVEEARLASLAEWLDTPGAAAAFSRALGRAAHELPYGSSVGRPTQSRDP